MFYTLEIVVSLLGMKKSGGYYIGRCPVCHYPAAFSVCKSSNGGLSMTCHAGQCSWESILTALKNLGLGACPTNFFSPVTFIRDYQKSEQSNVRHSQNETSAKRIWQESLAAEGTLAEKYLRSRGLTLKIPKTLRFHPGIYHTSGSIFPAMIALVEGIKPDGTVAIHRTYLDAQTAKKAKLANNKMRLVEKLGASVHLAEPIDTLAVAEGIETGLSVQQATNIPTWVGLSTGGICSLILPEVKRVIICADHDEAGLKAARQAADNYYKQGKAAEVVYPPEPGLDFNDVLQKMVGS